MPSLRDRTLDILFARLSSQSRTDHDDLDIEIMFHDHLVIVVGAHHPLAQRRKIKFEELGKESWLLVPANGWNTRILQRAFDQHNMPLPRAALVCYSFHLRANMLAHGNYITAMPYSAMLFATDRYNLKVLPVEITNDQWPLGVVRLKNRAVSPVVQLFIDHLREFIIRAAPDQVPEATKKRARAAGLKAGRATP
jgi:DNA-binding transcriptional LysR family regulator